MIGDAYMVLAGGPVPSQDHAESITNYGLGILEETASIIDPSTSDHLRIRVGESSVKVAFPTAIFDGLRDKCTRI